MFIKIILFVACFVILYQQTIADEKTKLKFVQILFRHGDRSPISLYPNDPNPASVWTEGLGKLTLLGRKQHFALGRFFHKLYENFTTFSPLEVNVISSDNDRCIRSAETNMASFFAPGPEWIFEKNVNWQPITVRYVPEIEDKYLETDSYCPRADKEKERIVNSPEGQKIIAEHQEMFDNMTFYSGYTIANWTQAAYFYDVNFIERRYNLTTPSWVDPYWDQLRNVTSMSFLWSYNSTLIRRLRVGPLLQLIIERMQQKIAGRLSKLKFQIYSGHDTNIALVLGALNLYNNIAPPYCSSLLFELHEMSNGAHAIRLLFQNSSKPEENVEEPRVMIIEGCSEFCPLEYFINYTRHLIPDDWKEECELDKTFIDKVKEQKMAIGWFFALTAVIILSLSVYALWRIYSRRQSKKSVSAEKYNTFPAT